MVFEPVQTKVNIQEEESFIIKWKYQILNLHIQKYYLTNFHYLTSTMYEDNQIYIWCSCGCHGEPHPGEAPHGHKLLYMPSLISKLSAQEELQSKSKKEKYQRKFKRRVHHRKIHAKWARVPPLSQLENLETLSDTVLWIPNKLTRKRALAGWVHK